MEDGEAFYVVRKGNMVAVYASLSDCQAQISSSAKILLASHGLKNALYTVDVKYVDEGLFGNLVPCIPQDDGGPSSASPDLSLSCIKLESPSEEEASSQCLLKDRSLSISESLSRDQVISRTYLPMNEVPNYTVQNLSGNYVIGRTYLSVNEVPNYTVQNLSSSYMSYILEFDGATNVYGGDKAGAGVVIRTEDGRVVARLRQSLLPHSNNEAVLCSLILGLKYARKKAFSCICLKSGSEQVCEQEFNVDADVQAHLAINLPLGQVYAEVGEEFSWLV